MAHPSLDTFKKAWAFRRQDPKISEVDLQQIKVLPLNEAGNIWRDYVSKEHLHPDHFDEQDWIKQPLQFVAKCFWQKAWESDDASLPKEIQEYLMSWGQETRVYFCYNNEEVIEVVFDVFQRSWKNFLFFDNGPVLLGRKKSQAIQFFSDGSCRLLKRA